MEFMDEYNHKTPEVMYIPRCMPTKELEHLYEYALEGCDCETECKNGDQCCCLGRSGTFYAYNGVDRPETYSIRENDKRKPTYECNENCKCRGRFCGNRLVQFGPRKYLEVRSCDDPAKGLGLFTLSGIPKGTFVCEYAGEIITEEDALRRFKSNSEEGKMNYIFCVREQFGDKATKTFIDPTYFGNIGRYINHSCAPNCRLVPVRVNAAVPILGIFANQEIEGNLEITYDYGEGNQRSECTRKPCRCNGADCRKFLPYDIF